MVAGQFGLPIPRPTVGAAPSIYRTGTQFIKTGTAGNIMTADAGVWAGPRQTVGYAWYVGTGTSLATVTNATFASYSVSAADSGKTVKCKVTVTNPYGSRTVDTDVARIIVA